MNMFYDRQQHHRRSIRLKGDDCRQPGAFFITICTRNWACLFGTALEGKMQLYSMENIGRQCRLAIPEHFTHVVLDEFFVMPNHGHGIIWIVEKLDNNKNDTTKIVRAKNFSPLQI